MKFIYNKIIILTFSSLLLGCVTNIPKQSSQTDNTSQSSGNMKLYPYKSAILKFKDGSSLTWDEWGKKTYETDGNEAIVLNNGSEYRIKHGSKRIIKDRNLILDWLIVADQDLHANYVDNDARNAIVNMHKTETVAGVKCNIWLNDIPFPSHRYCLYDNKVMLKHQEYRNDKWSVRKEATIAKFNPSLEQNLFSKLPNYPVESFTKYNDDEAFHKMLKNEPTEYRKALEVAETIKARGIEKKEDIKRYARDHKKSIELYKNHKVGNGIYYPVRENVAKTKHIKYIEKNLNALQIEIEKANGLHLEKLATFYPIRYGQTALWKRNLQQSFRQFFNARVKQLSPQKQATTLHDYFSMIAIMERPIYK